MAGDEGSTVPIGVSGSTGGLEVGAIVASGGVRLRGTAPPGGPEGMVPGSTGAPGWATAGVLAVTATVVGDVRPDPP